MNDGEKNQGNIDNDLDYEIDSNLPFTPFDEGDYNEVDDIPSNPKRGSNPGKAIDTGGKAIQATGKGVDVAGKGMQVAGKGMQAAGKGMDAAGSALAKAGSALSSTGLGAIAGVPLTALGAAGKAAGTATNAAGKGVETAGKGVSKTGKTMQNAGKKVSDTGKRIKEATNKKSRTKPLKQKKNNQDNTNIENGNNFDKMKSKSKSEVKKNEKNLNKNKKKAELFKKMHPIEAKKMALKKALLPIIPFVLFFVIGIFVILITVTMVHDAIENSIDEFASFSQKLDNFMYGYGFKDTQQAFYDELNDLCNDYGCSTNGSGLNAPLLLSTLFYPETSGYGEIDYSSIDEDASEDEDDSFALTAIKEYVKKRFVQVSDDGLQYTAGQIKRMKRLAKNQVSKGSSGSYVFDEDKYKKYLFDKYFEDNKEFSDILGTIDGEKRDARKNQIYSEIVDNSDLYQEIYMDKVGASSEDYVESCVGAINQKLVSELNMPVDIPDNITISFDDNYSYGIIDGKSHNGVDLNETTAGVKLGSKVYAVANGKIDSIEDTKCSNEKKCGKSIKIKHNLVLDNEEYKFFTIYSNVTLKSGLKKGSTISKGDEIGTIYNNSDNIEGLHFAFLDANTDDKGIEIDPTNIFIQCSTAGDDWLIHQSAFTKSEFIQKIQNYCKNSGCDDDLQMFADNADFIYDVSKKNNISPELVVVRASNEGFSPGGGTNNYWGIGCFNNDPSSCLSYSSFEEGIKGFANLDIVKNANTASEMMQKYAYIGDYWINPGDSSNGGCHYYPYINGYMSTSRSNIVAGYCSVDKKCSGSNCGKTTEEDQIAYSKWQVESQLLGFRKEYFGY